MNILHIVTSFPRPEDGSTIFTDLAEALCEAGHNVTVVVSEQPKNQNRTQMYIERNIEVLRVVTGNYFDVGFIEKGITTLKAPIIIKKSIQKFLGNREFDLILYGSPPVTNGSLVSWAKKKFNCPSYLMLKDIFPQNSLDLGIMNRVHPMYYYFKKKERDLFESANIIGCMSQANKDYIVDHNPQLIQQKLEIFPNTKKITMKYKTKDNHMRKELNIPLDACVYLFGGNMGKPQYIDLLEEAIINFKNNNDMYFLFIGRGTERYKLEEAIERYAIKNAQVIENLPRSDYEQIIKEIDIGLIMLNPNFTIPNYPSRILSYMEFEKPVLAATDINTDIKGLILNEAKCGQWVWSGDKLKFFRALENMSKNDNLVQMGKNGRKYIEENLTVEKSVKIIEKHFEKKGG